MIHRITVVIWNTTTSEKPFKEKNANLVSRSKYDLTKMGNAIDKILIVIYFYSKHYFHNCSIAQYSKLTYKLSEIIINE